MVGIPCALTSLWIAIHRLRVRTWILLVRSRRCGRKRRAIAQSKSSGTGKREIMRHIGWAWLVASSILLAWRAGAETRPQYGGAPHAAGGGGPGALYPWGVEE